MVSCLCLNDLICKWLAVCTIHKISVVEAEHGSFYAGESMTCGGCRHRGSRDGGVLGRLVAPLRLGGAELLPTVAKLYGALGVRSLRSTALQQLGATLLEQSARYEAALAALCKTGIRTAEKRLAVQVGPFSGMVSMICLPL